MLHVDDDGTMYKKQCWSLFDNLGKLQPIGIREFIGNFFFMIPKRSPSGRDTETIYGRKRPGIMSWCNLS